MRYTHHRGQAHVSNWVRLKFTAMNLKKLARWKARRHPPLFRLLYFHSTYLFLLLRPAWRFPSLTAFRQAEAAGQRPAACFGKRGAYLRFSFWFWRCSFWLFCWFCSRSFWLFRFSIENTSFRLQRVSSSRRNLRRPAGLKTPSSEFRGYSCHRIRKLFKKEKNLC